MADDTTICIVGNLTDSPELRYTPSGAPVTNFSIASTPRYFDRQANEFKEAETLFMRCTLWREAAENTVETLTKGTRVIAQGRLKARSYQDKEGNNRTSWELDVEEIGPSLRFATAQVTRTQKGSRGGGQPAGQPGGDWGAPTQNDPWGGGQPAGGGWDAPAGGTSEPPPF